MNVLPMLMSAVLASGIEIPDRYWPAFPVPSRLVVSESHNGVPFAEGVLLHTTAGLVANRTREVGEGEMVWIGLGSLPYAEWLRRWRERHAVPVEPGPFATWDLVDRYREQGIIKGYILYRRDTPGRPLYSGTPENTSVNVATSLCAVLGGVAVEEGLEAEAKAHGLICLEDVRQRDEQWLWDNHRDRFSRGILALQDPACFVIRYSAVAMDALVLSGTGPLYEAALSRLAPASPVLGWGIGNEDAIAGPSSLAGAFQTATNWCANLPVLSAGETGLAYTFDGFAPERPATAMPQMASAAQSVQIPGGDGPRYVSFILSDGDNVQWLMLNFCAGARDARQYWDSPDRGTIPFGWSIPPMHLLQLCPYTLDFLRESATPNDGFVLWSGGYYYPDWFGRQRSEQGILSAHARRTALYMKHTGIRLMGVNIQDWDSKHAMEAYGTYASSMPDLDALFVFQYAPYTAGQGQIRWISAADDRQLPVMTAKYAIWAGRPVGDPAEGSPAKVASLINAWANQPVSRPEDRFAWVIVHCWSWFREAGANASWQDEEVEQKAWQDPAVARGYRPAAWCAGRLSSKVHVVTPAGLVSRLRDACDQTR